MMTDKDFLLDLLQNYTRAVHRTISEMTLDALRWQPDAEANNIAVTMWHICRAFDVLAVRILDTQNPDSELWYLKGWSVRTGYDPRGLGTGGLGNLSGYSQEEVGQVPILPAADLLLYFDQVTKALQNRITSMPVEALYEPTGTWTPLNQTAYVFIRNFLMDAREHLGEIKAIWYMWDRRERAKDAPRLE
jgi:hypothetical protein